MPVDRVVAQVRENRDSKAGPPDHRNRGQVAFQADMFDGSNVVLLATPADRDRSRVTLGGIMHRVRASFSVARLVREGMMAAPTSRSRRFRQQTRGPGPSPICRRCCLTLTMATRWRSSSATAAMSRASCCSSGAVPLRSARWASRPRQPQPPPRRPTARVPRPACILMSLGANDTASAPFVDYTNDVLYVGDDIGRLHTFSGVFAGTPGEVTGVFPVAVSTGNVLSPPVYDGTLVSVGSNCAANTTNCNGLHCTVDARFGNTCSDATHTVTYAANDTIDVQVQRSSASPGTNLTFRVELGWRVGYSATAALNAPDGTGGTGGIIIDNAVSGGGFQIYYAQRGSAQGSPRPGVAVQASQAGLN